MVAARCATRVPCDSIGKEFDDLRACSIARLLRAETSIRASETRLRSPGISSPVGGNVLYLASGGCLGVAWTGSWTESPVRTVQSGPSVHRSVVSVQAAHVLRWAGLLIIRRSWVRAPPNLSCGDAPLSARCDRAAGLPIRARRTQNAGVELSAERRGRRGHPHPRRPTRQLADVDLLLRLQRHGHQRLVIGVIDLDRRLDGGLGKLGPLLLGQPGRSPVVKRAAEGAGQAPAQVRNTPVRSGN
jgi:hypothetical protein